MQINRHIAVALAFIDRIAVRAGILFIVLLLTCAPYITYYDNSQPPLLSDSHPRAALIKQTAADYARALGIEPPVIRVYNRGSKSSRAPGLPTQILLSEAVFNEAAYSDAQVRALLAHELAHGARWDSYRYYTKISSLSVEKERKADCLGARLAGEDAMVELFTHHKHEVDQAAKDHDDLHPTFEERIETSRQCGRKAKA